MTKPATEQTFDDALRDVPAPGRELTPEEHDAFVRRKVSATLKALDEGRMRTIPAEEVWRNLGLRG